MFGFNVTRFMVLICIVLGHGVSAAYAPNMGNQGITVHNNHLLGQVDNVFDVPFAQNNLNNNALVEQGSMQQENDLASLPPLVPSSPFFSNELPYMSSLPSNGLNNNAPLNGQVSMGWDQRSIRALSPCFTLSTTIPFDVLASKHNNPLLQNNNLNYGQETNNGLPIEQPPSIAWDNESTGFNFNPPSCFTQPTIAPRYASFANNYNEPPIQNNLNGYQDLNITLPTFRSQEQPSIGLQERSILATPYLSTPAELTTTANDEASKAVEVNALPPMIDASAQRKKRKVTPATLNKCESVPLTPRNNIALSKSEGTPHKSESVPLIALARRSQSVTPQVIHNKKREVFPCYLCNKCFSKKHHLTRHIKSVHFNEKPYKCPHCGKRFAENFNLKRHARTHTGEKPHPCVLCKKSFTRNDSLKKHVQEVHTKNKSFICVVCEKSYTQKNNLNRHMKTTHFKENHDCPKCNKSFTRSDGLRKHIENIHLKKKRYQCPRCKSKFSESGSLKKHIRSVHNQEKPFKCDLCNKRYKQKNSLNDHMKKKHSKVS